MSQELPQIQITADGSNTLFLPHLNETYHSLHGALSESLHVYVQHGLKIVLEQQLKEIMVFEIGLGTAMNLFLFLDHLPKGVKCKYYSIEPYPLTMDLLNTYYSNCHVLPKSIAYLPKIVSQLNQWHSINDQLDVYVDTSKLEEINALNVINRLGGKANLVLFDAFAPSKQPEMWSISSISKVEQMMAENAILTTYCAQGQFKRNLKSLGFDVSHPKGANGKREMTLAIKIA